MKNSTTAQGHVCRLRSEVPKVMALAVFAFAWFGSGLALAKETDDAPEWGPPIGSIIEVLQADDQDGNPRELSNLSGERGLLLFLSRSADW